MSMSSPKIRRFARHALVATTGVAAPGRAQLASAFDQLCDRLRTRLQPIFGSDAIRALFTRSLHVATSEFPWLRDVIPRGAELCSVKGLDTLGTHLEPGLLADGLAAVLAHDVGLLSTLIGDDLVMPLVEEAWATASLSDRPASNEGTNERIP
jgi:hypothetical protein